jgi:hypothetical protein
MWPCSCVNKACNVKVKARGGKVKAKDLDSEGSRPRPKAVVLGSRPGTNITDSYQSVIRVFNRIFNPQLSEWNIDRPCQCVVANELCQLESDQSEEKTQRRSHYSLNDSEISLNFNPKTRHHHIRCFLLLAL